MHCLMWERRREERSSCVQTVHETQTKLVKLGSADGISIKNLLLHTVLLSSKLRQFLTPRIPFFVFLLNGTHQTQIDCHTEQI